MPYHQEDHRSEQFSLWELDQMPVQTRLHVMMKTWRQVAVVAKDYLALLIGWLKPWQNEENINVWHIFFIDINICYLVFFISDIFFFIGKEQKNCMISCWSQKSIHVEITWQHITTILCTIMAYQSSPNSDSMAPFGTQKVLRKENREEKCKRNFWGKQKIGLNLIN